VQLAGTVDISPDQSVQSNGELKGCGRRDAAYSSGSPSINCSSSTSFGARSRSLR
jgi:hypothetical protein